MRRVVIGSGLALALAIAAFFATRQDRLILIATGATSQTLCSKTFVAGLPPDETYAADMRPEPGMGLIDWALHYDVDRERKRVRTTVAGLFESVSVYRDGFGCVLLHPGATQVVLPPPRDVAGTALVSDLAGPDVVVAENTGVRAAIDHAFDEPVAVARLNTQAVVVVYEGRIVGERYAPGYGIDTPLLSHSIAKSVISALIGVLARDGKLSASSPVPAMSWHQAEGDQRAEVSIDNLLRMDAGLPLDEGIGPGLAQRMWFVESDTAAFAEQTPFAAAPNTQWRYSNLSYALLSRIVAEQAGGGPAGVRAFAMRELFEPLGMRHAVMEFDGAGTPAGSNAMLATAREWAQFGLLYLNDGIAGGQRILPEGWVKYSATPTLDSGYGAGFWLNTTSAPMPVWGAHWGMPGAPRDAYFARGYLGQYIVIVPSEKLVVVRFGASHSGGGNIAGVGALVHDVIAALHREG